jgi:hypothetical protein
MIDSSATAGIFENPIPAQARLAVRQFLLHILLSSVHKREHGDREFAILSIEMS